MLEGTRGSIYPALKKMSAVPGATTKNVQFNIPSHRGLTSLQSAEIIAEHFQNKPGVSTS